MTPTGGANPGTQCIIDTQDHIRIDSVESTNIEEPTMIDRIGLNIVVGQYNHIVGGDGEGLTRNGDAVAGTEDSSIQDSGKVIDSRSRASMNNLQHGLPSGRCGDCISCSKRASQIPSPNVPPGSPTLPGSESPSSYDLDKNLERSLIGPLRVRLEQVITEAIAITNSNRDEKHLPFPMLDRSSPLPSPMAAGRLGPQTADQYSSVVSAYFDQKLERLLKEKIPVKFANSLRPGLTAGLSAALSESLNLHLTFLTEKHADPKSWVLMLQNAIDRPFGTGLEWGYKARGLGVRLIPCRCFETIPAVFRGMFDWGMNCLVLMAVAVVILSFLWVLRRSGVGRVFRRFYLKTKADLKERVLGKLEPW